MKNTNKLFSKSLCFLTLLVVLFWGCRKKDVFVEANSTQYQELKQQFFNVSATNDAEIKQLVNDIKKQDELLKFLPEFVRKNGMPKWDKVLYKTTNSASAIETKKIGSNSTGTAASSSTSTQPSQGVFFIPLQSNTSQKIKSYITAYKHNDSLYTYRLYNRDSLNTIKPSSTGAKNNLLNTQAVFGYFEKSVNNKDSIEVSSPSRSKIKNVQISFGAANNSSLSSNSNGGIISPTNGCTIEIAISISYTLELWVDGSGNLLALRETMVVQVYIAIDCSGGGGGGGCTCGSTPPSGGTIPGGGSSAPGYNNNYWWNYGSGWPWYTGNNNGYYDPNWNWWWTGYQGGGNLFPIEIIPDPTALGNFFDDPNVFEDDPMQITFDYDQNPWPTISNVLSSSQFVGYDYRNCIQLAIAQILKAGLRDLGYGSAFKVYDANGGSYPNIAKSGINYIITKLQAGKPVIVGVDNRHGTPSSSNADGKTDHFVTVVGSGQDSKGKYLTFYDNATNLESKGTSSLNKLYYDDATGIITGKSAVPYANAYGDYIVTQIRKNQ